jgi:putative SOS response-associated peptidase YedK
MCGRYTLAGTDPSALRDRFPLGESVEIRQRFNVAPTDPVLAVVDGKAGPQGELLRWGLVPHWADSLASGARRINARAETVATTAAFRDSFARHRCLVVADGFYEWEKLEGGGKQPWHITLAGGEPFAFAGLWAAWHSPAGDPVRTCAIVTTAASPALARVHDRMPAILPRAAEDSWLDPAGEPSGLQALLRPRPDADLAMRPVSRAVNDARYDGPACLDPPEPEPARATAPRLF